MLENYLVAVYDFRSKQNYIYKTNRVKEIIGASEIIKNAYRNVIAQDAGVYYSDKNSQFSLKSFDASDIQGTVLYEGGGNIVLLFKGRDNFLKFNQRLSWYLIENAPGLTPVCGMAEFDSLADKTFSQITCGIFENLSEYKRLAPPVLSTDVLPFTQIDRKTSLPITFKQTGWQEISLSSESKKKLDAYDAIDKAEHINKYAQIFDNLAYRKGKESLLAIIYIDGNGMGQRVKDNIPPNTSFEDGVNKQREFSRKINDVFVDNPLKAIEETVGKVLEKRAKDKQEVFAMRRIIGGGDEITIVCSARQVRKVLKVYFDALAAEGFSACAGVAVCHSHAPFADVYTIAEECCQSGKNRIKELKNPAEDKSYIDAYFCHGAITGDLETLRARIVSGYTNMPYCIKGDDEEHSYQKLERLGQELQKVNRTNVKALRDAAFSSPTDFELELMRVKSNYPGLSIVLEDIPTLCDAADFYDLWFERGDENAQD